MSAKLAIEDREEHIKKIKKEIDESKDKEFKDSAKELVKALEGQIAEIKEQPVLKIKVKPEAELSKAEKTNLEEIKARMSN